MHELGYSTVKFNRISLVMPQTIYLCVPGAPNSAKFRGGGGLQKAIQDSTKGGLQYFFYFLRVNNKTF